MATEVGANPAISAQRKRALEAIERTYAVTKPDIPQQWDKTEKGAPDRGGKRRKGGETAPAATPEPDSAVQKGHFTFLGRAARPRAAWNSDEEAHAAYNELSQTVHENLLKPHIKHLNAGINTVNLVIHDLLQNGDSAQKYMQGSRSIKFDDRLLLDNFVPGHNALQNARAKALQSHSKRSRKHMSMRQHRACGSLEFPPNCSKFEVFKPMHDMWKEYIVKLLKESGIVNVLTHRKHQLGNILLTADLQGAILQVVECKTNTFTGVSGIMIRETSETFGIITQSDKFRVSFSLSLLLLLPPPPPAPSLGAVRCKQCYYYFASLLLLLLLFLLRRAAAEAVGGATASAVAATRLLPARLRKLMAAQLDPLLAMNIFDLATSLRPVNFFPCSPVRHGASTVARYS
ncbi:hypothetical protein Taro_045726 [Colocasia esculenta]|uniref:Uncharacterized protein n=1 Tax=Colocasia esculenta TaxID=4460 RepID=A0A843WS09_COLES|nr:hypothetical protein [Colocasia esculenta]